MMKKGLMILGLIGLVGGPGPASTQRAASARGQSRTRRVPPFQIHWLPSERDDIDVAHLRGIMQNGSGHLLSYVQIEINLADNSGAQVDVAMVNTTNLPAGARWRFDATSWVHGVGDLHVTSVFYRWCEAEGSERRQQRLTPQHHSKRQQSVAGGDIGALDQYASAIRWFAPRLSVGTSKRLSQSIIYHSVNHGLDARLVLAVLVTEGALGRVQWRGGKLWMGSRQPESTIKSLTRDLSQRGRGLTQAGSQPPPWEQVKKALARRYRQMHPASGGSGDSGDAVYIGEVGRLYFQTCGLNPPDDAVPTKEDMPTTDGEGKGGSEALYPEAAQYFAAREANRLVVEDMTFTLVQANAARWKGALIEVRGVIRGCEQRDDGVTFIIERDAGDSFVIDAQQKLPMHTMDIARTVRVLARIPPNAPSFDRLQLVAVTSEYEAAALDIEREKRHIEREMRRGSPAARTSPRRTTGTGSPVLSPRTRMAHPLSTSTWGSSQTTPR